MAEGLVRKRRIRAGHRGVVTKRLQEVTELLTAIEAGEMADPAKLVPLKLTLQEKLDTLKRLDNEILDLVEDDAVLTQEIDQADVINQGIYEALVKIEGHHPTTLFSGTGTGHAPGASRTHTSSRAKLPKLTLRTFDGELTTWTTFWDSYEAAVHGNPELSDIDKFTYLKSLVERSAKEAISGLALTSANYLEAVSILEKRFGNKQAIITKHMDMLLNVEAVTSQHNVVALRRMYDRVESHIRGLHALGISSDSYGSLLSSVLLKKLPHELRLIVSRKISDDDWNTDTVMKVFEEELKARERTPIMPRDSGSRHGRDQPTSVALMTGGQKPSCCYCQQGHASSECRNVSQLDARKQSLRTTGRCYICLRKGHISKECRSNARCSKCGGRHHISICYQTRPQPTSSAPVEHTRHPTQLPRANQETAEKPCLNPSAKSFGTTSISLYVKSNKTVLLQTARAIAFNLGNPAIQKEIRIILDCGSQRSYITEQTRDALALKSLGSRTMSIMTFGSTEEKRQDSDVVEIGVQTRGGTSQKLMLFTVPLISEPVASTPVQLCMEKYCHLRHLDLADPSDGLDQVEPDILIGSDHYWDLITGETIRGNGGPVAVHTRLGWVLSGPISSMGTTQHFTNLITHVLRVDTASVSKGTERLENQLRAFWELESLGISADTESSVYEQFENNIVFRDGRYEVLLPWKDPLAVIPDNYQLSIKRFKSLWRRLKQSPEILKRYNGVIRDQIENGIVQVVERPDQVDGERVHYLPHHAVIKQDKETTKLRVVYDASARSNGPSLNNSLHVGPKFNQKILDILLRFRVHRLALTADIEKAFLMISVADKDRDVLRFFWANNIEEENPDVQVLRFARVVFGVASSPFLLNATIRHHLEGYQLSHPELVRQLLQSIFVDDVVSGARDEEGAYQLYISSKELLKEGGFNLRKFITNDPLLQRRIDRDEESLMKAPGLETEVETYTETTLGRSQRTLSGERKVLGVRWNVDDDLLVFDLRDIASIANQFEPTKRHVVSVIGRFYDPIGLISPVIIKFKMLFQELCYSKLEWDQPLSGELLSKWKALIDDLSNSQSIQISRSYLSEVEDPVKSFRLCGFCDASTGAYAAVIYLLMKTDTAHSVRLVASKTRVSPIQGQTIPRLELLGALLLARLIVSVTKSLETDINLNASVCYTDSKVAFYWILGSDRSWKPFIQNRVTEIRGLVPAIQWRHCPGRSNPADVPSRGLSPLELANHTLWIKGPDWLIDLETEEIHELQMPDECIPELIAKERKAIGVLLTSTVAERMGTSQFIDIKKYSDLDHLLRVTANVFKFIGKLRCTQPSETALQLMSRAEILWVREAQASLTTDRNFESWRKQLGLFLDPTGVWRCGGRLSNADISYSAKHPAILPRGHGFTALLVRRAHERVLHNGVKETLTEMRTRYWIIRGRSLIKQLIHSCVTCRRYEAQPYCVPPPPPLPPFRVQEEPPFTFTGVDFAGPIYIKRDSQKVCDVKVWICLFTCCVTRAIHLDIVPNLSAPSFLRCFKRFVARRGIPHKIISDNGKTFKATARTLKKILSHEDVAQHLSGVKVEWTFNIPRAPWWGGVFERMVQSTKRCLRKMVGQAKFSYDELLTAITEIEMIVNSRPISYVSPEDLDEPLTPSHLLVGRRILSLPDNLYYDREEDYDPGTNPTILTKRMKHLSKTLDRFWKRWRSEYLLELREAHRFRKRTPGTTPVSVGDIVVVHDDTKRRGFWKLGKIEETLPGRDGLIRGAIVRVYTGGKRSKLFHRPLPRLYPLEINCLRDTSQEQNNQLEPQDTQADYQSDPREVQAETQAPQSTLDESSVRGESPMDPETPPSSREHPTRRSREHPTRRSRRAAAFEARDRIVAQTLD